VWTMCGSLVICGKVSIPSVQGERSITHSLFTIYFSLCLFNCELYFVMFFLVFSVCEGALGLSILVSMIRGFGNDYFQSYRVLWC
jgi:NADH:ubiquinone oxidoreductase subunit K